MRWLRRPPGCGSPGAARSSATKTSPAATTSPARGAARYGLPPDAVEDTLPDFEARGWVRRQSFAGSSAWSLTDAGRAENEHRLAAELDRAGLLPGASPAGAARVAAIDVNVVHATAWLKDRVTPNDSRFTSMPTADPRGTTVVSRV